MKKLIFGVSITIVTVAQAIPPHLSSNFRALALTGNVVTAPALKRAFDKHENRSFSTTPQLTLFDDGPGRIQICDGGQSRIQQQEKKQQQKEKSFVHRLLLPGMVAGSVGAAFVAKELISRLDPEKELARKEAEYSAKIAYDKQQGLDNAILHCIDSHEELEKLFACIEQGANVNAQDEHGNTALIKTIRQGLTDHAQILIAHGADINQGDAKEKTPIMWACDKGQLDLVKKFLEDPRLKRISYTTNGRTLWHYALKKRCREIIALLLTDPACRKLLKKVNSWGNSSLCVFDKKIIIEGCGFGFGPIEIKVPCIRSEDIDYLEYLLMLPEIQNGINARAWPRLNTFLEAVILDRRTNKDIKKKVVELLLKYDKINSCSAYELIKDNEGLKDIQLLLLEHMKRKREKRFFRFGN